MTEPLLIFDILGTGLLDREQEHVFLQWCIIQTVRPAFAHALSTHNLLAEGRMMMAASSADMVATLAAQIAEEARATMFRQLSLWIKRAVDYSDPRPAWEAAREAAVWSLIYSQRTKDVESQVAQYRVFDKQIRQTHGLKLHEISGY